MQVLNASTISAAFQTTVDLLAGWASNDPPLCWFRGVKDNSLLLQPGACWRPNYNEFEPLVSFAQEGVAFADVGSITDWNFYYFAQHHGIPTRLLDWTESFASALFFAFDGWDGRTTPCVWVMQPSSLNDVMLGWNGIMAPENIDDMSLWLPKAIAHPTHRVQQDQQGCSYDNDWPLAIYPKKSNLRISAQQGTFTVHGRHREPLDALYEKRGGIIADTFARIDMVGFDKPTVLKHLALLGIRRSAIYPDIENCVRQLQETYGW
ncbi:MAG: hypothetical protein ACI8P0_001505 [Planctomycetaceae bacterium]|jgi:hypothetical protein